MNNARDYSVILRNNPTKPSFPHAFLWPYGICCCPQTSRVFVSDTHQNKVFVLDFTTGELLFSFGSEGEEMGQFRCPRGLAISPDGDQVFVADDENNRVQVFTPTGDFLFSFGGVRGPQGMAMDPLRGELHIANYWSHCISVHDTKDGRLLRRYGREGKIDGEFKFPTGVTFSPHSRFMYVVDQLTSKVSVFKTNGVFVVSFGKRDLLGTQKCGLGMGAFKFIAAASGSGHVALSDRTQDRVQVLDSEGNWVGQVRGFAEVACVGFAPNGDILAAVRTKDQDGYVLRAF